MKILLVIGLIVPLGVLSHMETKSSPQSLDFPSNICLSWLSGSCIGGDNGLTNTAVQLTYTYFESNLYNAIGPSLEKSTERNISYTLDYPVAMPSETRIATYRFTQPEHGGGDCNCVEIYFDSNCTAKIRLESDMCDILYYYAFASDDH